MKRKRTQLPKQVFLCHTHADKRFVRKLARDFSALGIHVWLDEWELAEGDSLHGCIGAALNTSSYVGVVLSPDSVKSKWCQAELQQALAREMRSGEKVVIPLLCRRVIVPPFLEDRLYADFYRKYYVALTNVAGLIHAADRRDISEALDHERPKSTDDVREILESVGCETISYLSVKDFAQLKRLLDKAGIRFTGDEIDISPVVPKKKGAKKRPATKGKRPIMRRRLKR